MQADDPSRSAEPVGLTPDDNYNSGQVLSGCVVALATAAGGAAAPTDAHWQEVATKLDLAKAYQEMGDKDGAHELLNEVLKEGDTAQQQQAQTMLTALS